MNENAWRLAPYPPAEVVFAVRAGAGENAADLFGPIPAREEDLLALAREREPDRERRLRTLEWLLPQLSAPKSAAGRESLALVADPRTRIVIGGQQPALAGGPLYIYAKALTVVALAKTLRAGGVPAVPLFWIADEDHDVAELTPGGVPRPGAPMWTAEVPFQPGRRPIADLRLPGSMDLTTAYRGVLPPTGERERVLNLLTATSDPSPSVWFERFFLGLLADEGILCVRPASFRGAQALAISRELSQPGSLATDVRALGSARLRELGLPVPIPNPADLPFFMVGADGGRHRLDVTVGGVRVRSSDGTVFDTATLRERLRVEPQKFSADALLRPLVQDENLEPFATVVGPTEMAYHLELAGAYAARAIPRPVLMPRLRVQVLEESDAQALRRLGLAPGDLGPHVPLERIVPSDAAAELAQAFREPGQRLIDLATTLASREGTSAALRKRATRLAERWRADLDKLTDVLHRDLDDGVAEDRRFVAAARDALWPGGRAAERETSILFTISHFGRDILRQMRDSYDPYDARPRVLVRCPELALPPADSAGFRETAEETATHE